MNDFVKSWQRALLRAGRAVSVDGDFGPETLSASLAALRASDEPNKAVMSKPLPDIKAHVPALPKLTRSVRELIWHCAATPEGRDFTVGQIRGWHKNRGWKDIGYHFVVYRDGSIHLGRPLDQTGAHVAGRNEGTIGACYVGGVSRDGKTAKDTRTPAQKAAMLALTEAIAGKYPIKRISGHNEFAAKACPSFDVRTDGLGNIKGFTRGKRR